MAPQRDLRAEGPPAEPPADERAREGEAGGRRVFESRFRVRSYELDSFGHLNHAVWFNYFEQSRFDALEAGGFGAARVAERGWAVYVVRAEADFRREALLGQEVLVRTQVASARNSSMTLRHVALDPARPATVFAEGRVVAVWIGPAGRPMRIPQEVRAALGVQASK